MDFESLWFSCCCFDFWKCSCPHVRGWLCVFQDPLFPFGFLHFEYDMFQCSDFGIYPSWCSLSFSNCGLPSIMNFAKFSAIITSDISSALSSLLSPSGFLIIHLLYLCRTCPTVLWCSVLFFFILFSLCISILEVSVDVSSSSRILS